MSKLEEAFDVKDFRNQGHQLIDQLADHLAAAQKGDHKVVQYNVSPEAELSRWRDYKFESLGQFFGDILSSNMQVHHRRYIGHQVSAPAPVSALAGLLSEFANCGMGVYEMSAGGTAIEKIVVQEFCKAVGYDMDSSDGVLTSGGTLANLTGLLAARADYLTKHPHKRPYILVSNQAHFCVDRGAMTMGLKSDQVVKINTTDDFKIDTSQLENSINQIIKSGGHIMAIVACACTTSTGSYDDLKTIANICERHNIWMHVDGAHGGAAVFSKRYKSICAHIERADSIIIDAHKMMLTPALATAVLFKKKKDSYRTFAIEADYLFEKNDEEWYNLAKRTYETTKYMMCIKIYALFKYHGLELIDEYVTRQYDLTRKFAAHLKEQADFEIAHEPMSNILCFRYTPKESSHLNELNTAIRKQLLEKGDFYIVQTTLNGDLYLRVTIMSPYTSMEDLKELLSVIRDLQKK